MGNSNNHPGNPHPSKNRVFSAALLPPAASSEKPDFSTAGFSGYFPLRGVVEGFYGTYYTAPQRDRLIHFLGEHGFNLYVYAPKNDRCHRARWREPYPEAVMARFAQTMDLARTAGVDFCYTISPAETIRFTDDADFASLTAKLGAFYERGGRFFGLLFDDIQPELRHEADRARFAGPPQAHAHLANRLYQWLLGLDPACTLLCCPVDYAGSAPFPPALHQLGAAIHPAIALFYTGPQTCSATITAADVSAFTRATGRVPLLWDNYPVNDLAMEPELHLGPLQGRDPLLYTATQGYVANLMQQPAASHLPLLTLAAYLADPHRYDPAAAWEQALGTIGGTGTASTAALKLFAENSRFSVLDGAAPEPLNALAREALAALHRGESASASPAVQALDRYLSDLNEACYYLKHYLADLELRHDLLPWLELLDFWQDMARHALAVQRGREQGQPATGSPASRSLQIAVEWRERVARHPRRISGNVLLPLVNFVLDGVPQARATFPVNNHQIIAEAGMLATPEK